VPSRLALVMILVIGEDAGILGGCHPARKLRRMGTACLAATIRVGSNRDAELVGRGPVPPRDQRRLAPSRALRRRE